MTPISASWILLAAFLLSWAAAALWVGQTTGALPSREQIPLYAGCAVYFALLAAATVLIPVLRIRLWPSNALIDWLLVVVCAAGFLSCWWARLHLGKLWSGGVVVKEGHRVVDSGPYGVVRHPIYSGVFLALIAFAATRGRPIDLAIAVGIVLLFGLKARLEERFLRAQFGAAYDEYRARVPMLLPRVWMRRSRSR